MNRYYPQAYRNRDERMKIVIEMPQEVIEKDAEGYFNYFGCMSKTLYETLQNGIVLPQNPTNGDMLKTVFPYIEVKDKCNMYYSVDIENLSEDVGLNTVGFRKDWWDAPYEREEG